jgi:hypothetical protein
MSDKHGHTVDPVEDFEAELEDLDVDTEDIEEGGEESVGSKPAKAKKAAEPKNPKRGDLPDGYVTPVAFAKYLTENEIEHDAEGNAKVVPPQVVYSYIKNAPKDHPFPNTEAGDLKQVEDNNGVPRRAFLLEEGLEWWENRRKRAAERKANAAAKKAKPAKKVDKPIAGPPGEDDEIEEAVEAE